MTVMSTLVDKVGGRGGIKTMYFMHAFFVLNQEHYVFTL